MTKYIFLVSVLILGSLADDSVIGNPQNESPDKDDPYWSEVRVTWCQTVDESEHCFEKMPLTAYEAKDAGWELISDDCENYGRYNGYRFVLDRDWSLVLLYDMYGFLCGIQTNLLVDELESCNSTEFSYAFNLVHYFLKTKFDGQDYYTLTAYFQNPRTICDSGHSFPEYLDEGIGEYGLWFQYGNSPYVTDFVPPYRPAAVEKKWNEAQCVDAMGFHNFKYMQKWEDDHCSTIPPYSVIFDENDYMRGFVIMAMGTCTSNHSRYEYLPSGAVKFVMNGDDAPECVQPFQDECGMTTMHVYFVREPDTFIC